MYEKPLPIRVDPYEGECLHSFLMRTAALYGVTTDKLVAHCLGTEKRHPVDSLTIAPDDLDVQRLAEHVRIAPEQLSTLTLPNKYPSISDRTVAYRGAVADPDTGNETPSGHLRFGWCPICLIEDRAGGGDHFLRLDWSVATTTMCPVHERPLIAQCHHCYHFVVCPDYAIYGRQMALICPTCQTPLDARFGYDGVSDAHGQRWNMDDQIKTAWRILIRYERHFRSVLKQRTATSKKKDIQNEILSLLDLLLHAEKPNTRRLVDLMESPYFPVHSKLGYPTRHLKQPFRVCHLIERRKALAIVICLLEDRFEPFGFDASHRPLHDIRDLMYRDRYDQFERHIFNIARLALPI